MVEGSSFVLGAFFQFLAHQDYSRPFRTAFPSDIIFPPLKLIGHDKEW